MDNTNGNGNDNANEAKTPDEKKNLGAENAELKKRSEVSIGVDEKGFLTLKIHVAQNSWLVIGFLEEAKGWYRKYIREESEKRKQASIIKPNAGKWKNPFRFGRG